MSTVFVVRNQQGLFLNRQQAWVEGGQAAALYRTPHRDEALNTLFEVTVRDIALRAQVVACALDHHNQPRIDALAPELEPSPHDGAKRYGSNVPTVTS